MIETSVTFGSSHSFPRVMDRRSKIVASVIAAYFGTYGIIFLVVE